MILQMKRLKCNLCDLAKAHNIRSFPHYSKKLTKSTENGIYSQVAIVKMKRLAQNQERNLGQDKDIHILF